MPAWRCRGIGKTLVQRIVNSMEDAPRQLVEMTVDESTIEHNGPFLFSCGFTCHGYLKDEGNRSTRDIAFYRLRSTAPVQGASGCCGI
jgi:ribosomal protein S18 acetylase RimI-like enzyme